MDVFHGEMRLCAVEERDVRPERLDGRPPAKPDGLRMTGVDLAGAYLGDGTVVRGYLGRAQPLPHENRRIVEVDELAALVEIDRRERERKAAPDEIGRLEGCAGQPLELLRDRGDRFAEA